MNTKDLLIKWNQAYRAGNPIVTDTVFDAELRDYCDSLPNHKAKAFKEMLFEEGGDVVHEFVMGSLSKCRYGEGELVKWLAAAKIKTLFLSAKIDGMSFVATYEDGLLIQAVTRGDGKTGIDITRKVAGYALPRMIKCVDRLVIRGELTLTGLSHSQLGFKNRRNGTVGVIGRDTLDFDKLSHVKAFCYEVMNATIGQEEQFRFLLNYGLSVPMWCTIRSDAGEIELKRVMEDFKSSVTYDIDGLVMSDVAWTNEPLKLPKNKAAFKVNSEGYPTTVIGVEWNLSKTGAIKPVLLLEPTEIDGTTVRRANGCNAQMMSNKATGIGAEVLIIKSGDIIPKVIGVTKGEHPKFPTHCPECGSTVKWKGVDLTCPASCGSAQTLQVASFLRDCGVENVTEKSLTKWGINFFADLLNWGADSSSKAQVKFVESLKANIFCKSEEDLFSNMYFDGAGTRTMVKLIQFYDGIDNLTTFINEPMKPGRKFPEGVGEKTIIKMKTDYNRNLKVLEAILKDGRYNFVQKRATTCTVSCKNLDGKSFLFTGTLSAPRKTFEAMVTAAGGTLSSSVSKNLDYLVVGDDAGSKLAKAQKLGVVTLTEAEFKAMI